MFETIWSGEVEQITDGEDSVRLYKEVLKLEGDVPLGVVRKHRLGGPTGPPLLLVHGFAQNRYSWHTSRRSMSAWLAERGYDVWNLELRGHGRSRDAGQSGAERFEDYEQDVLMVSAAMPAPAFWIGHSLGGAALYAAATRTTGPERAGTAPRGVVGIAGLYQFGQANPVVGAIARATHAMRDLPIMGRLNVRTRLAGQLISRLYGLSDVTGYAVPLSGWWPGSIEPELLEERLREGFDWTSMTVWQEMSRWAAEGRCDFDEAWTKTDVPLLVMLGDRDHLLPPADGRAAFDRSGSTDRTLLLFDDWHNEVHWGHLDLILGRYARKHVWRALEVWLHERSGMLPSGKARTARP